GQERNREPGLLARLGGAPDRCVLLRELLVVPAVRPALGLAPGDGLLEERDRLVRAPERTQRLADGVAGERDRLPFLRISLSCPARTAERRERGLVLARLVLVPAQVVEERSEPVGGRLVLVRDLDPPRRPLREAGAVGRGEGDHVRRVRGDEVAAVLERGRERGLEERPSLARVPARTEETPSLEVDPRLGDGAVPGERLRLADQLLALVEPVAETLDPRQLRQHLRATCARVLGGQLRLQALLASVEVAEIPKRTEPVGHGPTLGE